MDGMRRLGWGAAIVVVALLAACSSSTRPPTSRSSGPAAPSPVVSSSAAPVAVSALEPGERWIDLTMPGGSYTPHAPAGGTDDYRCILLDPKLTKGVFLSGVVLQPGNAALVHHAILYRVEPDQVPEAKAKDASDPSLGWSCFGDPGLSSGESGPLNVIDGAPWVAAFATRGGEQRFPAGTGEQLAAGSRLILQIHYNLLNGTGPDDTSLRLRVATASAHLTPLHTFLLPAPVELPCPAGVSGPLCNRDASIADVAKRFGTVAGFAPAGLQLLCGGSVAHPRAGPTKSCARPVPEPIKIRALAGHMHLLGRSITVDLLHPNGTSQRLLDIKSWDFDDQRATVLPTPVLARPGDQLKVTCTHDAKLRQEIPELAKLPPRYVVWGDGSSDEMCLGIVSYTDA